MFSEVGRLSVCRVTQLDPHVAGKADGAVHSEQLLGYFTVSPTRRFFFIFFKKGKDSGFICL